MHKMVRVFQESFVNDLHKKDDPSTIQRILHRLLRNEAWYYPTCKEERKIEMKRESLNTSIVLLHLQSGGWLAS